MSLARRLQIKPNYEPLESSIASSASQPAKKRADSALLKKAKKALKIAQKQKEKGQAEQDPQQEDVDDGGADTDVDEPTIQGLQSFTPEQIAFISSQIGKESKSMSEAFEKMSQSYIKYVQNMETTNKAGTATSTILQTLQQHLTTINQLIETSSVGRIRALRNFILSGAVTPTLSLEQRQMLLPKASEQVEAVITKITQALEYFQANQVADADVNDLGNTLFELMEEFTGGDRGVKGFIQNEIEKLVAENQNLIQQIQADRVELLKQELQNTQAQLQQGIIDQQNYLQKISDLEGAARFEMQQKERIEAMLRMEGEAYLNKIKSLVEANDGVINQMRQMEAVLRETQGLLYSAQQRLIVVETDFNSNAQLLKDLKQSNEEGVLQIQKQDAVILQLQELLKTARDSEEMALSQIQNYAKKNEELENQKRDLLFKNQQLMENANAAGASNTTKDIIVQQARDDLDKINKEKQELITKVATLEQDIQNVRNSTDQLIIQKQKEAVEVALQNINADYQQLVSQNKALGDSNFQLVKELTGFKRWYDNEFQIINIRANAPPITVQNPVMADQVAPATQQPLSAAGGEPPGGDPPPPGSAAGVDAIQRGRMRQQINQQIQMDITMEAASAAAAQEEQEAAQNPFTNTSTGFAVAYGVNFMDPSWRERVYPEFAASVFGDDIDPFQLAKLYEGLFLMKNIVFTDLNFFLSFTKKKQSTSPKKGVRSELSTLKPYWTKQRHPST
jgi:hypothetical protein